MFYTKAAIIAVMVLNGLSLSTSQLHADDGQVSGSVEVGRKPLAAGKIIFHAADGQFVGSKVKNGKYTIDSIPEATRKVTIEGEGVPRLYSFDDKTPLSIDVVAGDNSCDFKLL